MRCRYLCRIDKQGCVSCGQREFVQQAIIDDSLACTWVLTERERRWFDYREGQSCKACGTSKRVRMLLWSIGRLYGEDSCRRVLHLNQINNLGDPLKRFGSITATIFNPQLPLGAAIGDQVNEDMCRLTFPDGWFELAIHSETLEHVVDYKKALSEIHRVLKPGGRQVYTVPLLRGRNTRQRAALDRQNRITHLLPPSYHGSEDGFLVFWEFGGDFVNERAAFIEELHFDNYWGNPTVFSIVERKG